MVSGKVATIVREAILDTVTSLGFELVDVEFVKEGPNKYLRVYIDKPGGIFIDDCVTVNDAVTPIIDSLDPIDEAYVFEVSSPGLDRPLKTDRDFIKYKGEKVDISFFKAVDGKKQITGVLSGRNDNGDIVILGESGEEIVLDGKTVSSVKRTIEF